MDYTSRLDSKGHTVLEDENGKVFYFANLNEWAYYFLPSIEEQKIRLVEEAIDNVRTNLPEIPEELVEASASKENAWEVLWDWLEENGYAPGKRIVEAYSPTSGYRSGVERGLYVMWFDEHAPRFVCVFAQSFEDALEEAAGALRDFGWPGYFISDEDMQERYEEALAELREENDAENEDEEDLEQRAREAAEEDLTYTESGWIQSHDWGGDGPGTTDPDLIVAAVDLGVEEGADSD